jgi:hypothetical protein
MKRTVERIARLVPSGVRRALPKRLKEMARALIARPDAAVAHGVAPLPLPRPAREAAAAGVAPAEGLDILQKEHLDRAEYERKWRESFGHRLEEYFAMHRHRYYELFNTFAYFYPGMKGNPLVLEIGVSEFLILYKHFFPRIRLVTVDRPLANNGFAPSFCLERGGAERHYQADLNAADLSPRFGAPPLGRFDYIVCTEVLEHLTVNPAEFLESLLSLLLPQGLLYLTTPNFFRAENLAKIAAGVNPQMVVPRRGKNADAHHHFREYAMPELLAFVAEAGGRVVFHHFSDCWDAHDAAGSEPAVAREQRANLVLLIQRQPASASTG